jgi:hypothetical protein
MTAYTSEKQQKRHKQLFTRQALTINARLGMASLPLLYVPLRKHSLLKNASENALFAMISDLSSGAWNTKLRPCQGLVEQPLEAAANLLVTYP